MGHIVASIVGSIVASLVSGLVASLVSGLVASIVALISGLMHAASVYRRTNLQGSLRKMRSWMQYIFVNPRTKCT